MANDNHLSSVTLYNVTMNNHKYYTEFFELGQQKINFNFYELCLPDDDPVYTLKKVMEELDFTNLLAQYSNKGRNGFNPIMKYAVLVGGITNVALTKIDVFDTFDEIKVCVAYKDCRNDKIYTSNEFVNLYMRKSILERVFGDTSAVVIFIVILLGIFGSLGLWFRSIKKLKES